MTGSRDGDGLFLRVDSLQVPVPSLDEGLSFYGPLLGGSVRWRTPTSVALAMNDGTEVVLQTARPDPETDVLVDDAAEAAAAFVRAGGSVLVDPFDLPVGSGVVVADRWGTPMVLLDLSKGTFDTDSAGHVTGVSRKPSESHPPPALPDPSVIADVYVLVRQGDAVLLLLRSKTGYKDGQWGPPSGKVEPGETYREAAARETREEVGLSVSPGELRFAHTIERVPTAGHRWVGMFFEMNAPATPPVNLEPHKHTGMEFFPVDRLPGDTVDYVRHVLQQCEAGERYSEWRYDEVEDIP